nr:hypothetical protein [Tanacetum cinerariifolium]
MPYVNYYTSISKAMVEVICSLQLMPVRDMNSEKAKMMISRRKMEEERVAGKAQREADLLEFHNCSELFSPI